MCWQKNGNAARICRHAHPVQRETVCARVCLEPIIIAEVVVCAPLPIHEVCVCLSVIQQESEIHQCIRINKKQKWMNQNSQMLL